MLLYSVAVAVARPDLKARCYDVVPLAVNPNRLVVISIMANIIS